MSHSVQSTTQKLVCLFGLASFIWGSCSVPGLARNRTEILRIDRNYSANVQRYRRRWEIARRDQVLANGNWLATSSNSMAWMWYIDVGVVYRQHAHTVSRFLPGTNCGFRVSSGRSLFLDSGRKRNCYQVVEDLRVGQPRGFAHKTPHETPSATVANAAAAGEKVNSGAQIRPQAKAKAGAQTVAQAETPLDEATASGYFLSRSAVEERTLIGVLANPVQQPIEVTNQAGDLSSAEEGSVGNTIELRAGEFAIVRDDGRFVRGEFSIEKFYEKNPLTLGLGDTPEDLAYLDTLQSDAERELLSMIRTATLSAKIAQPPPGAFELRNPNSRETSPSLPSAPICSTIDFAQSEVDGLVVNDCFD